MENNLQERPQNAPAREIGVITEEIRTLRGQANAMALIYAVEIGRRLMEAKETLPHGEWGDWLKNEVDFSQSTANNLMRLFQEYGSSQISIFGASVDSKTFANLPYSKALQLLAIPADEREAFAEKVKADELTVRELKKAIEERDQAKKIADFQKQLKEELAEKLEEAQQAATEAELRADEAEKLRNQLEEAKKQIEAQTKKSDELSAKLKQSEKDPKIPKATLDKLKKEAEDAAKKQTEKKIEDVKKRLDEAEAKANQAMLKELKARSELEEAEKKLKTASPEIAGFKALFEQLQQTADRLRGMIQEISRNDPETGGKLGAALRAFGNTL